MFPLGVQKCLAIVSYGTERHRLSMSTPKSALEKQWRVRSRDLSDEIAKRASTAGLSISPELAAGLSTYLDLLARWNQKINLTALDVDRPSEEAIDRLVIEPLVAARSVLEQDGLAIDVGSGGGSPAVPMKLAVPTLRLILVESKVRKAAFLRETVRQLGLVNVEIENCRFQELASRAGLRGCADLVTVRAVRMDRESIEAIAALMKPGGRLFWFGTLKEVTGAVLAPLSHVETRPLVASRHAYLFVAMRT